MRAQILTQTTLLQNSNALKMDSKPVITAHGAGEWYYKSTILSMFFACHIPRKIPATQSEKVNINKTVMTQVHACTSRNFYHWLNRADTLISYSLMNIKVTFLSHHAWTQSHKCLQDLCRLDSLSSVDKPTAINKLNLVTTAWTACLITCRSDVSLGV